MDTALIVNPKDFEQKKAYFITKGINSIQIVSDFDRTLTTFFCNGKKTNTAIAQIRENNFFNAEYTKKSFALFDKYHPIEEDSSLSVEQKIPLMEEWWSKHLEIIVQYGMTREINDKIVKVQSKYVRKKFKQFFKTLNSKKVPVLILSSALGDVIEGVLKSHKVFTKNIHVISNFFDFDKNGKAKGYKGKIVHVFNKDESQIKETPYFSKIISRKNVILLGDSLGDLKMVGQIPYDEIIKVGFLYNKKDSQLEEYKKHFDIILFGDASLEFVNKLILEISKRDKRK